MPARRSFLAAGGGLLGLGTIAGCSPLGTINALVPGDTHERIADRRYGDDERQRLDLYRPLGRAPAGGWPAVLFFYGGSWNSGARADYRFVGEALASRGIVCGVADYRLYPQVAYPDFLRDCANAAAWISTGAVHLGLDARRLYLMGHSAGAYNAAMLALDARWLEGAGLAPARFAGWIGLAGPYDFVPIGNRAVRPVFHHPDVPRESQPIVHADRRAIRSFLGVAETDSFVDPQRNSARLAEHLERAGTEVTLRWYPRANHMTLAGAFARPLHWVAPVLDDVEAFVKQA
ncbi:MAG TPA: alpha/beta hydrolase [Methylibium sp.]|uniref:alpha/beta hydrolase n=1 Tax=Methylibium sp. TaxID=2067992 RepID=UPI002DB642CC|nr:alpha/beta hydrolase [Methylibium sp.]HEU4458165.1 alpha/beta hydrolase [Methylibium sp.]